MLISTILLATMHVIVRYLTAELHPFVVVFFRNLFGLIAVLPLIVRSGGIISFGIIAMLSWFYALSKVPVANATALSFSSTIFATLSAWIILREPMRYRRWFAIIAGLIGVLIVLQPGLEGFNRYALLAMLSAMAWGVGISLVKKLSTTDSTVSIVQWPTPTQMGWLFLVGCFASGGHYFMTSALRLADTAVVMSIDFTRLIWTGILGYILYYFSRSTSWPIKTGSRSKYKQINFRACF